MDSMVVVGTASYLATTAIISKDYVIFVVIFVGIVCFIIFDIFKNIINFFINNIYIVFKVDSVSSHLQPCDIIKDLSGRIRIKIFRQAVFSGFIIN